MQKTSYIWAKLQLPHFRGRSFQGGDGFIGGNIKDPNKAINGCGGSNSSGRVGGHGDDAETVTGISLETTQIIWVPQTHGLV